MVDVFVAFIRVVYGRMIYMSLPVSLHTIGTKIRRLAEPVSVTLLLVSLNNLDIKHFDMVFYTVLILESLRKRCHDMSRIITKQTKWHVRPAKTQISLGIRQRRLIRLGGCWFCWFCHVAAHIKSFYQTHVIARFSSYY